MGWGVGGVIWDDFWSVQRSERSLWGIFTELSVIAVNVGPLVVMVLKLG